MSEWASHALLAFMLIVAPITFLLIIRIYMSKKDEYYDNKEYPSKKYIVEDGGDESIYFLKEEEKLELNDYEDVKAFFIPDIINAPEYKIKDFTFNYDKESEMFILPADKEIQYPKEVVIEDNDFLIFAEDHKTRD